MSEAKIPRKNNSEKIKSYTFPEFPLKDILVGTTTDIENAVSHQNFFFEYIISGKGSLFINDKKHDFCQGNTIFIRKETNYSIVPNTSAPLKVVWITFSANYIEQMVTEYCIDSGVYNVDSINNFMNVFKFPDVDTDNTLAFYFSENIHQILIKLASKYHIDINAPAFSIKKMLNAKVYDTCSIIEIAKELHISKSTLIRVFKQNYKTTPYDYLLNKKMDIAKNLLVFSKLTIKNICYMLSFSDERYFSYLFTQKTGMSPNKYREKYMK